jgi:hypothetical protein
VGTALRLDRLTRFSEEARRVTTLNGRCSTSRMPSAEVSVRIADRIEGELPPEALPPHLRRRSRLLAFNPMDNLVSVLVPSVKSRADQEPERRTTLTVDRSRGVGVGRQIGEGGWIGVRK